MKTILRSEITEPIYLEIFNTEFHHDHEIIEDKHGTLRWKKNPDVDRLISHRIDLNHLVQLLHHLGYDKNSEPYRKLYRDMGYSLSGYWEVFYWQANNPKASEYKGVSKKVELSELEALWRYADNVRTILASNRDDSDNPTFKMSMSHTMNVVTSIMEELLDIILKHKNNKQ